MNPTKPGSLHDFPKNNSVVFSRITVIFVTGAPALDEDLRRRGGLGRVKVSRAPGPEYTVLKQKFRYPEKYSFSCQCPARENPIAVSEQEFFPSTPEFIFPLLGRPVRVISRGELFFLPNTFLPDISLAFQDRALVKDPPERLDHVLFHILYRLVPDGWE